MALDSDTEEHLLRDIERKGLPLSQVSLVDICDADPAVYGRSGESRRPVQQRFGKIKRLKPKGYLALLKKYKIKPSPVTLAGAEEEKESKKEEPESKDDNEEATIHFDTSTIRDDEETTIDDDEETSIDDDDDDEPTTNEEPTINEEPRSATSNLSNIASTFASLSINKPTMMFNTPTKTPVKKSPFLPSMTSPTPSTVDFAETATGEEDIMEDSIADQTLDFRNQNGTKNRPYITMVNCLCPEKNGPFDITCFEELEHNDRDRNGFHVRRSIDPQDMDAWGASIPSAVVFPWLVPLTGRVLFIKGPSRSFWIRDFKRYHNGRKPINCQVTGKFHEKSDTAIASDPNRETSYFLLVFPPDTVLDNYCFSNDHFVVQKNKNPMKLEANDIDNAFKKDVLGMTIWWRIAVAGGTLIRQAKDSENPENLYD
jgi:hypothetical protein